MKTLPAISPQQIISLSESPVETEERPKETVPLCVDLDGTLLRTDLLHESVLLLLKKHWWYLFVLPWWVWQGKAVLKQRIASRVELADLKLPLRDEVVALVKAARAEGRETVLATASDRHAVEAVAGQWHLFDRIEASDGKRNLAGSAKAARLVELFGERGFDYVGDQPVDLPVWSRGRRAIVVSRSPKLAAMARDVTSEVSVLVPDPTPLMAYVKAIRLHQWLKNLLIFLSPLTAHRYDWPIMLSAILAFLAFGLCSSSVYVINDLADLKADRLHHRKRLRPFAAGLLPLWQGGVLILLCLGGSVFVCQWLPPIFWFTLTGYFATTCLYTFWLKNQVVVDVMLLAMLYTSRVLAGAAATLLLPSFWLLALSMFTFMSLALVKRYSELLVMLSRQRTTAAGRGYKTDDLPVLMSLGTSAALTAVLVLAFYINQAGVANGYARPEALWLTVPPFLYWMARTWMKAHRGEMHEDPVIFAATDWQSQVIAVVITGAVVLAILG